MNVLFVSISSLPHMSAHSISLDMLREFRRNGHKVYVVCAIERRDNIETNLCEEDGCTVLRVKIGNNKRAGLIEKGLTSLLLPHKYIAAIKKYYADVKFDLVLYPTPPVTHVKTVKFIKKRDGARSYLMLKDIFPQNSVDIGMLSPKGVKGIIYRYFRRQERELYAISDKIGCMSQANIEYVLKHNPEVPREKLEICPNSIEPFDMSISQAERQAVREKYGFPQDKKLFAYGGNLGRPQDVRFIVECLKACADVENACFVIAGRGSDRHYLEEYVEAEKPSHVKLLDHLPRAEYDAMVACCDVGLIFLDHRFTIPNFPSRLLAYMQAKLPVLACTDPNTDVGKVITEGGFGWWCESNDVAGFKKLLTEVADMPLTEDMKQREYDYLNREFNTQAVYKRVFEKIQK